MGSQQKHTNTDCQQVGKSLKMSSTQGPRKTNSCLLKSLFFSEIRQNGPQQQNRSGQGPAQRFLFGSQAWSLALDHHDHDHDHDDDDRDQACWLLATQRV